MSSSITADENKREVLLTRLGGESALKTAVYDFYARLLEDEELEPFFKGQDMKALRDHQYKFMEIAFTHIPEDLDVPKLIAEKHAKLFAKGLNETHFDLVAGHLVATLEHLGVGKTEIGEVVSIVGPLREVFKSNAQKAEERKEVLLDKLGGPAALKGVIYEFYGRIMFDEQLAPFFAHTDMKKLREHQYKFMEIAFTEIPKDLDIVKYLSDTHARLFEKGLNATHFDLVAGHLVGTLQHLNVKQNLIDEVVATVGPLRVVFDK